MFIYWFIDALKIEIKPTDSMIHWNSLASRAWIVYHIVNCPDGEKARHCIESNGDVEKGKTRQLDGIPHLTEVCMLLFENLLHLQDGDDHNKHGAKDLREHGQRTGRRIVAKRLDNFHSRRPDCIAVRRVLEQDHRQVEECTAWIPRREFDKDYAHVLVDPVAGAEAVDHVGRLLPCLSKIGYVSTSGVRSYLSLVDVSVEFESRRSTSGHVSQMKQLTGTLERSWL